jgi:predicted RNase H-like nuclease (RuvC/YqgF family)
MAFGKKQPETAALEVEIKFLKDKIEDLTKRCEEYRQETIRLRDALVSKEAPLYWNDKKAAEWDAKNPPDPKLIARARKEQEMYQQLTRQMEEPLFDDADDMISKFQETLGAVTSQSLHGNSES